MDFDFQRLKWNAYSAGKSFCYFCDTDSTTFFTKEGFARHCAAKHLDANTGNRFNFEDNWKGSRDALKTAMLIETEEFLDKLSEFNKVSISVNHESWYFYVMTSKQQRQMQSCQLRSLPCLGGGGVMVSHPVTNYFRSQVRQTIFFTA